MVEPCPPPRLKVGLTGGIASGKSTACRYFADLGAPVVDADVEARAVVEPGSSALEAIKSAFGEDVVGPTGQLDRRHMRDLVFSDPERRETLEAILHPAIRKRLFEKAQAAAYPYVILAIPLLVESGLQRYLQRVVVVDVDPQVQRERVMVRDQINDATANAMIASQASRAERLAIADDVLDNSGPESALRPQVAALHERYLALADTVGTPS